MKTGLTDDEMVRVRAALEAVPAVEKAVLFGSRAMGLARSNSDVDILLYGDALRTRDVLRVASLLDATTLPYQFDLIRYDANNAALLEHVRQYGKVIFQRQEMASQSKPIWKSSGMASEWRMRPISYGASVYSGFAFKSEDFSNAGIQVVKIKNVNNRGVDLTETAFFPTEKLTDKHSKFLLQDRDVLIAMTGQGSVGRVGRIRLNKNRNVLLNQRVGKFVVIDNKLDMNYLFYVISTPHYERVLFDAGSGSGQPNLSPQTIGSIEIPFPPLEEQRTIAHILGTLDDKIELNWRMNETLEAMARALFKAWFVDFEPVCAKLDGRWRRGQSLPGLPAHLYDLFPDRLVESELGEIPGGWTIESIKSLTSNIQYGLTQSASKIKCGPHFLRITDIQGGRINWDSVPFCQVTNQELEKYKIQKGDIFVARTGASTGENTYIVSAPESVFASYLIRFQFDDPATGRYVGNFMRTDSYFEHVANNLGGSAQPNANANTLSMAKLIFPNHEIVSMFSRIIDGIDVKRRKNDEQISALAAIRDTLLPKLISGELRVPNMEHIVGEQ